MAGSARSSGGSDRRLTGSGYRYRRVVTPARSRPAGEGNGTRAPRSGPAQTDPTQTATRFLRLLADGDVDGAVDLMHPDVEYVNVSMPPMRGRERVRRAFHKAMGLSGTGFEVYLHAVSDDGRSALTERTDVLIWGRLRVQIWVCGRFDVVDGQIVLWRDYFDWANLVVAVVRGLFGIVVPALAPRPPVAAEGG